MGTDNNLAGVASSFALRIDARPTDISVLIQDIYGSAIEKSKQQPALNFERYLGQFQQCVKEEVKERLEQAKNENNIKQVKKLEHIQSLTGKPYNWARNGARLGLAVDLVLIVEHGKEFLEALAHQSEHLLSEFPLFSGFLGLTIAKAAQGTANGDDLNHSQRRAYIELLLPYMLLVAGYTSMDQLQAAGGRLLGLVSASLLAGGQNLGPKTIERIEAGEQNIEPVKALRQLFEASFVGANSMLPFTGKVSSERLAEVTEQLSTVYYKLSKTPENILPDEYKEYSDALFATGLSILSSMSGWGLAGQGLADGNPLQTALGLALAGSYIMIGLSKVMKSLPESQDALDKKAFAEEVTAVLNDIPWDEINEQAHVLEQIITGYVENAHAVFERSTDPREKVIIARELEKFLEWQGSTPLLFADEHIATMIQQIFSDKDVVPEYEDVEEPLQKGTARNVAATGRVKVNVNIPGITPIANRILGEGEQAEGTPISSHFPAIQKFAEGLATAYTLRNIECVASAESLLATEGMKLD